MLPTKKILLATDAWEPQINGVVRTWKTIIALAQSRGIQVDVVSPDGHTSIPCPTYPEIRLALWPVQTIHEALRDPKLGHVHIATEGPVGLWTRMACVTRGKRFTSSFHTRFPEYLSQRLPVPERATYRFLRWFHQESKAVLVPTPSIQRELMHHGFDNAKPWTRGVDTKIFHPDGPRLTDADQSPIFLYVGRVAVEKNVEAFLESPLPGRKIVVGDGPARDDLSKKYPGVEFVGYKSGEELAVYYRSAKVFVFPSKTDTFGLVMLEAMACGTPVAAYPVPGPIDVVGDSDGACLDDDLTKAATKAMSLNRDAALQHASRYSWDHCLDMWLESLVPLNR